MAVPLSLSFLQILFFYGTNSPFPREQTVSWERLRSGAGPSSVMACSTANLQPPDPSMLSAALQMCCDALVRDNSHVDELLSQCVDAEEKISKHDFRKLCHALGVLFPREVLDALFDTFDDGSGSLDHQVFLLKARSAMVAAEHSLTPRGAPKGRSARERTEARRAQHHRTSMERLQQHAVEGERSDEEQRQGMLDEKREERLHAMRAKRAAARRSALDRRERYWMRRERDAQRVAQAFAEAQAAASGEVCFLPSLPAAQQVARQTWAKDTTRERAAERADSIAQVGALSDAATSQSLSNESQALPQRNHYVSR